MVISSTQVMRRPGTVIRLLSFRGPRGRFVRLSTPIATSGREFTMVRLPTSVEATIGAEVMLSGVLRLARNANGVEYLRLSGQVAAR